MTDQQRLWRSFAAVILLFAFVRFQVSLAHAGLNRWTAHGPEGGEIRSFAVDPGNPQVVYVVTNEVYNRVFKSADGGNTWTPIEFGFSEFSLTAFIVVPQTPMVLYASGGAPGGGIAFRRSQKYGWRQHLAGEQ